MAEEFVFHNQQRGRPKDWKHPFTWTDEEVHALVEKELGVGFDTVFATGWKVLIKIWEMPEKNAAGLYIPEVLRANNQAFCGKILGFGGCAMRDPCRFPDGPTHTYGEWAIFRAYAERPLRINGKLIATVSDDQFECLSTKPEDLDTVLKLEEEYKGD